MTGEGKTARKDSKQERSGSILFRIRKPSISSGLGKKRQPTLEEQSGELEICDRCRPVPLPAHKAAYLGHLRCLAALERDAPGKMTATDRNGATPLHLAVRQMKLDAVLWLLEHCHSLNRAKAHGGETPVLIAAAQGSKECLEVLTESEREQTVRLEMVMDVDNQGLSSIHLATLKDREDCVAWLIKHFGSKLVIAQTQSGITPVHIAAATGGLAVLKVLVKKNKKGASFVDAAGTTPAYFAAQEGQLETLQYLVEHCKVDPLARCDDGMTTMHAATQGGHLHVVQWLVELLGNDIISTRTRDHATAVHFAAAMGQDETLKWILEQPKTEGVVNMADAEQGTPAHDAADNGHVECLRILKAHGAHLNAKDRDGATPLSLALESDNPDCRRWAAEEERQSQSGKEIAKRPSRMEIDALLTAELTELAMEAKKSQTLPVGSGRQPRAGSPHPQSRFRRTSSERAQSGESASDLYAVPARLAKKRWDGGVGPVKAGAAKEDRDIKEARADHEASSEDFDEISELTKRDGEKKIPIQRISAASLEPPDLPPRTDASNEIVEAIPASQEGNDNQHTEEETDHPTAAEPESPKHEGEEDDLPGSPRPTALFSESALKPSSPKKRPHSAGPQATKQQHLKDDKAPHSAPDSPVQERANGSQPGTPTLLHVNYPKLTGRVGLFDSPTKSTNSSPTASPLPSPLVVRRPFSFAAKPHGSPTVTRSHSMPKSPTNNDDRPSLAAVDVKKWKSLGSADTPNLQAYGKPAKVAKLLRDKAEDEEIGEASP